MTVLTMAVPDFGGVSRDVDTAGAVMAKIDATNTLITALNALITTQNGYVDGLETLGTAGNASAATTATQTTTANTTLSTISTKLTTIDGHVDGLEGQLTTINTAIDLTNTRLSSIGGYTDGLETLIGLTNTAITALTASFNANGPNTRANAAVVVDGHAATGTQTTITSSIAVQTILAANNSRSGAVIFNDSTQRLYLLLSATGTVSATVKTLDVLAGAAYDVPANYSGIIKGIWASANGFAYVTEFV
jgi:hypothetical protein